MRRRSPRWRRPRRMIDEDFLWRSSGVQSMHATVEEMAMSLVDRLLIGQGANDPRVNVRESEQIVEAIEKNKGSVTYVVYPDEGHGFARPENRIDFNARAEKFLADCLGGRYEPISSERVAGSTGVVKVVGK